MLQGIPKALGASAWLPQREGTCKPCGDEAAHSLWRCGPAPLSLPAALSQPHCTLQNPSHLHQVPRKQKKWQARALSKGGCGGSGVPGCLHPLSAAFPDLLHLKSGKGAIKAPWALAGRSVIVHLHARERMSNGSRHEGGITEPDYPTPALLPLPLSICLCGGLWDPSVQPCSGGHGKCTKDREQTKIYFCWPSHLITVRPQRYVPC